jgi:methylenetetrahydrofolate dehydrogenase (NADP+)/methenyltetrahydrofolate cyclohydrolase
MSARLIDGKAIAASVRAEVKAKAAELAARTGVRPGLTVILVGDDPASQVYVRNKGKAADEAGFVSRQIDLPADTREPELLETVERLNADASVHGILVQLPLPRQIDAKRVIEAIDPRKDVDGLHPVNAASCSRGARVHPLHPLRYPPDARPREGGAQGEARRGRRAQQSRGQARPPCSCCRATRR